jgi:hypothetical protein
MDKLNMQICQRALIIVSFLLLISSCIRLQELGVTALFAAQFPGILEPPIIPAKLVVGILSRYPEADELIYNITNRFTSVRNGSVRIMFVRCLEVDSRNTTHLTKGWTAFLNCSSKPKKWEMCDKLLAWLKFAEEQYPQAKFIAKSDDDAYIHADKLLSFVVHLSNKWPSDNLYAGRGMQIFTGQHNGLCFGPVPFIGGMMEIFSPTLIHGMYCSSSFAQGSEDVGIAYGLMHSKLHYTMVSCDSCFHDKEFGHSNQSIVVHGFKTSSNQKMLDIASTLDNTYRNTGIEDHKLVLHKSHGINPAPYHLWGDGCSNGCIQVGAILPRNVDRLSHFVNSLLRPAVVYDIGLENEDFLNLSLKFRSKISLERFHSSNASVDAMLQSVSIMYNSTCVSWTDI